MNKQLRKEESAEMNKFSIVLLSFLLVISAVFSCYPYVKATEVGKSVISGLDFLKKEDQATSPKEDETTAAEETTAEETTVPVTTVPVTTIPETTAPPQTTVPETTAPPVTIPPVTAPPVTQPPQTTPPVVTEPPTDYVPPSPAPATEFDTSLFIGDSRTMGLLYFGGLGNADVFATKGMTVFRAFTETISVRSIGTTKLDNLLNVRKYERVYIMLGINEIGSNLEGIKAKYTALVNKVIETQPNAIIYLCANLHITHSRSQRDSTYNNTRLNAINNFVATLADGSKTRYVDVNVIFDDSNKAFGAAYTTDDFHPMPKYYKQWTQWLAEVT